MPDTIRLRIYEKELAELEGRAARLREKIALIKKDNIASSVPSEPEPASIVDNFITEMPVYKDNIAGEPVKYCECGCGTPVKRRFVRGHSWQRHGQSGKLSKGL